MSAASCFPPLLVIKLLIAAVPLLAVGTASAADDVEGHGAPLAGLVAGAVEGTWLDPQEPAWAPLRGRRTEVCAMTGGEGALGGIAADKLPTVGGLVVSGLVRHYPVDRLAIVFGVRSYLGLDGIPATGTTASSVSSLLAGARYDLVRENRFSLMWDLYSGPSLFAFADVNRSGRGVFNLGAASVALGGEMGTGLSMRYSIGPWTGEARAAVGGRAGATTRALDGPFSALYAAADVGVTWGFP